MIYKLTLSSILLSISLSASDIPSGVELQKMVNEMRAAYGLLDEKDGKKSKSKYDVNKKYTDKEIKAQVDEMERLMKTDPVLKKVYGN